MQLLASHGPLQVSHLLSNINMASVELGSFQCHLNRMLVTMTRLQLQQEHLAYEMLGKVDTYLWNPRRNPLGPHAVSSTVLVVYIENCVLYVWSIECMELRVLCIWSIECV